MTKLLYDGFHKIEAVNVEMKGKMVQRERIVIPSAVSAIVTDQDGDLLLVSQYRPTIGRNTLEIPAGIIDKDYLTPYGHMLVELEEECGIYDFDIDFSNHCYDPILKYFMVTGSSDATMELYRVRCTSRAKRIEREQDHDVDYAEWFPKEKIREMFEQGTFIDPKTLIAVQTYLTEELD